MSRIPRGSARRGRAVWLVALGLLCGGATRAMAEGTPAPAAKIDPLFARWDKKDTPGVIVGIAQGGTVVHLRGYGMANLEHGVALTADTVSESGSVAKQFTAAAVALLAVRGKLSLEDPVRKHLPELRPVMDGVTVRMLLNHTGGVRDIHGLFELMGRPSYSSLHTNAEVLRAMARQRRLNFEPGTEYVYSNGGYILAALVVERVTKMTFGAFCVEQVFKPLGMTRTQWRDDFTAVVPGRAAGYEPRPAGGYRIDMPYSNLVGNGGLLTTVGDLLTWNASFDAASGEWAEVVKVLQTRAKLKDGRELDYGLGLSIDDYAGVPEIAHGGATSGYRTYLARFPTKGLSIALLGNTAEFNGRTAAHRIAQVILELKTPAPPRRVEVAAEELGRMAGLYHSGRTDAVLNLALANGRLRLNGAELVPVGARSFVLGESGFEFGEPGSDGRPMRLTVTSPNATTVFARKAAAKPDAQELAAYAGTYYSEELGVAGTVTASGGEIRWTRWPGAPVSGEATFADAFWFSRGWHVTFTRDASGKVDGCEWTNASGRCRQIRFGRR